MWHSWAQIFFINDIRIDTTAGRVIQSAFWFTILILVSSYTANMAAIMTQQQLFRYLSQINQIYGKRISAEPVYEGIIRSYGAQFIETSETLEVGDLSNFMISEDLDGKLIHKQKLIL